MIVVISIPMMPICGIIEMAAAVMIFMGWPDGRFSMIYWIVGMVVILAGFQSISEAAKLSEIA
jgi:uncharacterized membrane protein